MALTECANGHLYDTDQYQSCPYCQGGIKRMEFGGGFGGPVSDIGKTVGVAGAAGMGYTEQVGPAGAGEEIGATVAPASYREKELDLGKTVAVMKKDLALEPVVGWLVCIDGAEKGKDYRIEARNNSIGRGDKMDICIKGDNTISRENQAHLAYDSKHNAFHLIPSDSTNPIYINDQPVYVPTKLGNADLIEMGQSKFLFIPLCTDLFNWQDGLTRKEE